MLSWSQTTKDFNLYRIARTENYDLISKMHNCQYFLIHLKILYFFIFLERINTRGQNK